MACLQDLSQARSRWGVQTDGFFSIFSIKTIFPGIGDIPTLEALSALGGDMVVPVTSVSRPSMLAVLAGKGVATKNYSYTWRRRWPVDQLARGAPGCALLLHPNGINSVAVPPWWAYPKYRSRVYGTTS
jgi:hypothetical protein